MTFLQRHFRWAESRSLRRVMGPDGRVTDLIPEGCHYSLGFAFVGHEVMLPVSQSTFEWVLNRLYPKA